jgi:hypothetical protein
MIFKKRLTSLPQIFWIFLFILLFVGYIPIESYAAPRNITPVYVKRPPHLTGTLKDPVWKKGAFISHFIQYSPDNGKPATMKTTVRILYTKTAIYFGIHCYDPHPSKILAKQLVRDGNQGTDDQFLIIIDPTDSGQNGYFFAVNPLGTKLDALVGEDGSLVDVNWNGIWHSRAKIVKTGWIAEIAIPFSTLNFSSKNTTLGINFQRDIRRKQEVDVWTAWQRIYGIYTLSQAGAIGPFHGIKSTKLQLFEPYVSGEYQRNVSEPFGFYGTSGFDYKFGITSGIMGRATVNPDFSQTPADLEQINFSPIPLYLPEDRSFFLEREDIFNAGFSGLNQLFFSRNIGIDPVTGAVVPLEGGLKVDGSIENEDIGVLAVRQDATSLTPPINYGVERLKQRFSSGSYVGFIGIQKDVPGDSLLNNDTYGTDYNLNFLNSHFGIGGFFAETNTPGLKGNNWGGLLGADYQNDWVNATFLQEDQEPNFNPELGFRKFSDDNTTDLNETFTIRPEILNIRHVQFFDEFLHVNFLQGEPFDSDFHYNTTILFNDGSFLYFQPYDKTDWNLPASFQPIPNLTVQAGEYVTQDRVISYNSNPTSLFSYFLSYYWGRTFTGPEHGINYAISINPGIHFSAGYSHSDQTLLLVAGKIHLILDTDSLTYAFSRYLNLQVQYQNDSTAPHPGSEDAILDWRFRTFSHLYAIYILGPQFVSSITGTSPLQENQKFELKYTYTFF